MFRGVNVGIAARICQECISTAQHQTISPAVVRAFSTNTDTPHVPHPFSRIVRKLKRFRDNLHPKRQPMERLNPGNRRIFRFATDYGTIPMGRMERDGGEYCIMSERLPTLIIPDLTDFKLKPYVQGTGFKPQTGDQITLGPK